MLVNQTLNESKVKLMDCIFLSVLVFLSSFLYIQHLGFYSDDWAFLGTMSTSTDQSFVGQFKSLFHDHDSTMRPIQFIYIASLYKLFGTSPLGYHLVNVCVILSITILFYLIIREFNLPRLFSLAVPLVYLLLPHYSSTRFWFASSNINLSMSFYFLSLFAALKAINLQRIRYWSWVILSVVFLIGSVFTYELAVPLFFLNPILVWYHSEKLQSSSHIKKMHKKNLSAFLVIYLLGLIIAMTFKFIGSERLFLPGEDVTDIFTHILSIIKRIFVFGKYDYGINIIQAFRVNYGDYGIGLPWVVGLILRNFFNWKINSVGVVICLIIFLYLYKVTDKSHIVLLTPKNMLKVIAGGLIVFGLGYGIYLTNNNLFLKIYGVHNRFNTVAAAGVSLTMVGSMGFVSSLIRADRWRKGLFCALLAIWSSFGFIIIDTKATFWITAYRQEKKILADIRQNIPTIPSNSTMILDGICHYVGPAIVFNSSWDLAGALQMMYGDPTLRADVVSPYLYVKEDAIYTSLNLPETKYAYDNLFVYNFNKKRLYKLTNSQIARSYFDSSIMHHIDYWLQNCKYQKGMGLDAPVF